MRTIILSKPMSFLLILTISLIVTTQAQGESAVLDFTQISLEVIEDEGGRWGHSGGEISLDGDHVANYAMTQRTIWGGTDPQNTAMVTITVFVIGENPPQNMTLQGAHDFGSGVFIGSVSAASSELSWLIGANFSGDFGTDTLTITW